MAARQKPKQLLQVRPATCKGTGYDNRGCVRRAASELPCSVPSSTQAAGAEPPSLCSDKPRNCHSTESSSHKMAAHLRRRQWWRSRPQPAGERQGVPTQPIQPCASRDAAAPALCPRMQGSMPQTLSDLHPPLLQALTGPLQARQLQTLAGWGRCCCCCCAVPAAAPGSRLLTGCRGLPLPCRKSRPGRHQQAPPAPRPLPLQCCRPQQPSQLLAV